MRTLRAAGMTAASILAAAAALATAAPAGAVTGSSLGGYAFVAKIQFGQPGPTTAAHACTGVLVNRQWVLTAASCLTPDGGTPTPGAPALPTTVTVGRPDLTGTDGQVTTGVQIVTRTDRDIALLQLAAPTTITPAPVSTTAPATGQTWHITGYGRTGTDWAPTQQHQGDFTVQSSTATTAALTPADSTSALCVGDAGAPALQDVTGGGVTLAAIATGSGQGGCDGADPNAAHDATATRVDDLTDWIAQTVTPPPPTPSLPGGAGVWKNARLMASGDFNGQGRSDLLVVWTDGRVSVFPSDGNGGFLAEHTLLAANSRWTTAKLITSGDFDGSSLFDLMVVWNNGQVSSFTDTTTTKLGTEKAFAAAGSVYKDATQIAAGRFGASQYVSDLIVRWVDGELTLYTNVGGGKFGTENQLKKPNTLWKDATLLTSGQYSGTANWDLFVRWVDGELDTYPNTTAKGLGGEKRVQSTNKTWTYDTVMTTGRYTSNPLVDDLIIRWVDGETTMYTDTRQNQLGTEHTLVPTN